MSNSSPQGRRRLPRADRRPRQPRPAGPAVFGSILVAAIIAALYGANVLGLFELDPQSPFAISTGTTVVPAPTIEEVHKGPSNAAVQALAENTAMTTLGQNHFYDAEPVIAAGAEYRSYCSTDDSGHRTLGCFSAGRIYIFAVTEPALAGTQEVTAAHEMLHAAWQGLPQADRDALEPALLAAYTVARSDERVERDVAASIESYGASDVGDPIMINELHSILGTTVAGLDEQLEQHYSLYFSDRTAVLSQDTSARARFVELEAIVADLKSQSETRDAEIATARAAFTAAEANYVVASNEYAALVAIPLSTRNEVDTANAKAAEVNELARVTNALSEDVNSLIPSGNEIVAQWNTNADEYNRLQGMLDSSV